MEDALAFAAHFVRMLRTSRANDPAVLFYLPIHTSDTPAPLNVLQRSVDETSHAHLNGKFANWIDGARYDHPHIQICRREDANGGFVDTWKSALNCQGTGDSDGVGHGAVCARFQNVI